MNKFIVLMFFFFFEIRFWPELLGRRGHAEYRNACVNIRDTLMAMKVLRHFGQTIADIQINRNGFVIETYENKYINPYIEFYLTEYCSKSLNELTFVYGCQFEDVLKTSFEDIEKPLPNVIVLNIMQCPIGPKVLNKIFPNLESLQLISNRYKSFSVFKEHFPKLRKFSFMDRVSPRVPEEKLMEMIKLNPQLGEFRLYYQDNFTSKIIECIRDNLSALKKFSIFFSTFKHKIKDSQESVHFNNIVDFETNKISPINLFTFTKLKRISLDMTINLNDNHSYQPILDFIQRNTHLTSIMFGYVEGNLSNLFQFEYILSHIEELSILEYYFDAKKESLESPYHTMCSVLQILKGNQSLKKLIIKGDVVVNSRFESFCNAIASHTIDYKIISEKQKCEHKCDKWIFRCMHRNYKLVEFKIKKTESSTPIKYNCSFKKELIYRHFPFVAIECTKI